MRIQFFKIEDQYIERIMHKVTLKKILFYGHFYNNSNRLPSENEMQKKADFVLVLIISSNKFGFSIILKNNFFKEIV